MKSGVSRARNSTIPQALYARALKHVKVKISPQACEHDRFGRFLWLQR